MSPLKVLTRNKGSHDIGIHCGHMISLDLANPFNFSKDKRLSFYPTALKGCRDIVFTHGVRMGRWVGRGWEKVCPGCISEIVRCRKLTLVRDIG